MFDVFKKINSLYAPVVGKMISLEDVPDKMFSDKLLGDGVAFELYGDTIYAPCDCQVMMVASTKHAIGLKVSKKHEIMIHIGLDTVNYNGDGFELLVEEGERVKRGQPLIKVDLNFFSKNQVNLMTPMIITSKDSQFKIIENEKVNQNTKIIEFI